MGFEEFLPVDENEEENEKYKDRILIDDEDNKKIGENQVYDVITSKKHDWYDIIYELINSEQLDPWDIDLIVLTRRYFEKIAELEEKASSVSSETECLDFYISSKVLLAAALLLRIKSEFLLNKHIKSIDEILFGKKEEQKNIFEKIEIDENELPLLIPKTPLPRLKKVTLQELMAALNKAINTESRRIKREIAIKNAKKISEVDFPKFQRIDLKDRIRQFYARILTIVKKKNSETDEQLNKVGYSRLVGKEKEEKLACFLPLLHLSNTKKLWLEQENHLNEIWIYLYEYFDKNRNQFIENLERDIEEMREELKEDMENFEGEELIEEIENAEAMKKISKEEKDIEKEEKIDEISGFDENVL